MNPWALAALGLVAVALFIIFFLMVWKAGYRDGLAEASKIILASWKRAPDDGPAVLAENALGDALRKVVGLLSGRAAGPVVAPPREVPCPPCAEGGHERCQGGYLEAGGKGACGCGCARI